MARPHRCRFVECGPECSVFKPGGIPGRLLDTVNLAMDEFEAVRLADYEGLYQEPAAKQMGISRQTFGRILTDAHRKIADALVNGKALNIEGGVVKMPDTREFSCNDCGNVWNVPFGTGRPAECPACHGTNFCRSDKGGGCGGGGRMQNQNRCRRENRPGRQ